MSFWQIIATILCAIFSILCVDTDGPATLAPSAPQTGVPTMAPLPVPVTVPVEHLLH